MYSLLCKFVNRYIEDKNVTKLNGMHGGKLKINLKSL